MGQDPRLGKLKAFKEEVYRQRDEQLKGVWDPISRRRVPVEKIQITLTQEAVLFLLDALEGLYVAAEDDPKFGPWFDEYFPWEQKR